MELEEREANRTRLLHALYVKTDAKPQKAADIYALGNEIGLERSAAKDAAQWLVDRDFAAWRRFGGILAITPLGVDRVEGARQAPTESRPGMAPASVINIGTMTGDVQQAGASITNTTRTAPTTWSQYRVQIIGGAMAAIIAGVVLNFWLGMDPSGDPQRTDSQNGQVPAMAEHGLTCGGEPCVLLRVVNTVVNGVDQGVYVRSAPGHDGQRLTGARANDPIYGICTEPAGMDIGGDTRWVKSPFVIVPGDLAADGTFSDPKSHSDRQSHRFGWITATQLGPADVLDSLPSC